MGGIVYGVISAILTFGVIQMLYPGYWTAMNIATQAGVTGTVIAYYLISSIIGGIIFGIIFGAIYAALYDSLPGGSSVNKGIVLSVAFWIIFSLLLGFGTISAFIVSY